MHFSKRCNIKVHNLHSDLIPLLFLTSVHAHTQIHTDIYEIGSIGIVKARVITNFWNCLKAYF